VSKYRTGIGIRQYLSAITAAAIFLSSGLVAGYLYLLIRSTTITDVRGALEILVSSGALLMSGDDVEELSAREDFAKPAYARLYKILKDLTTANASKGFRENSIYVLKPTPDGKSMVFAAHLPGDEAAPGHIGTIASMKDPARNYMGEKYEFTPLMQEIMSGQLAFASTEIYTDTHGTWVSAYAPVRTKAGNIAGILEADYEVHSVTQKINREFRYVGLAVLTSAFLGIAMIVFLSGRIAKPIQSLADAVDRIAHGDFETGIRFDRGDEIGYLGEHINAMALSLDEKLRLSRYVSSETMRRVSADPASHAGQRADVCCLFADVRGFTKYSDRKDPAHVIEVLNELFAIESSCVNLYGGSIDKFIGDEIMVVFDGENASARAVRTALHIVDSTQEICAREHFSVGIGMHAGEVIRGDLGSSDRKDFTVIGSTVNLASRLCAAAGGGQILISDEVRRRASGEFQTSALGRARVKGFAELIPVYAVTGAEAA
jgi:class 3 adenylate cyclase